MQIPFSYKVGMALTASLNILIALLLGTVLILYGNANFVNQPAPWLVDKESTLALIETVHQEAKTAQFLAKENQTAILYNQDKLEKLVQAILSNQQRLEVVPSSEEP